MTTATGAGTERRATAPTAVPAPGPRARASVRALVVHRSDVARAGIAALLDEGSVADACATVPSVYEAFRLATAAPPSIVLFEYAPRTGADAARLLGGIWPRPSLVALVPDERTVRPRDCFAAGADAVIAIDQVSRDVFLGGVRSVLGGVTPLLIGFSGHGSAAADEPTSTDLLTRREREMLYLIGEGLTNREIAEALVLSIKTIETHRANLSRKLNIRSRAGLMRLAVTGGLGAGLAGTSAA
jgi:two-component system, NarL family, response regulator NreC